MISDVVAVTDGQVALRLLAATVAGVVLGVNRNLRGKPAGIRTHALVSIGSAILTIASFRMALSDGRLDTTGALRGVQGIITGIGFLGAGVILRGSHPRSVQGLTTAASLWLVSCLGIICGAGEWRLAALGLAFSLAVLILGGPMEGRIRSRFQRRARQPGERGDGHPGGSRGNE